MIHHMCLRLAYLCALPRLIVSISGSLSSISIVSVCFANIITRTTIPSDDCTQYIKLNLTDY